MTFVVFTDGGSRGNPGPAATGVAIFHTNLAIESIPQDSSQLGEPHTTLTTYLGKQTNNIAEWHAVIEALTWISNNNPEQEPVIHFLDSELVQRQIIGKYKVKDPGMKSYHSQYVNLKPNHYTCIHIRREYNKLADHIVNETLDQQ